MRQRFESNPGLGVTPIEKIILPTRSRDELPAVLVGLKWLWMNQAVKEEILCLVEAKVLANKKKTGRPGMDLWQMLVLGVVRLALDADWDRMEHIANYDMLLRQMLGVPAVLMGEEAERFHHQTLRDNVALVDEELLREINARVAAAGREVFATKEGAPVAALEIKVDTYVLETDVHFPTDLNLLWDAGRKCVDLIEKYRDQMGCALSGWRKAEDWRRRLKALERMTSKTVYGGGANKEKRVREAVREYLETGRELSEKVADSLLSLCDSGGLEIHWERLAYFQEMLAKHLDLVERRRLKEETIPATEKVYSLFEPHTEWIQKGKQRPNVELGHRLLVATDQNGLVQDYDVPIGGADVDQSVAVADRLLGRYGVESVSSMSFDKGFTRAEDRELLSLYVPTVVMPKRGKKSAEETERESQKKFVALRRQHSAVESDINALEHHGLNRWLDTGLEGYRRYVGYGILAFNLHVIGRRLLELGRVGPPVAKVA
jgi:transposase, IS5 family